MSEVRSAANVAYSKADAEALCAIAVAAANQHSQQTITALCDRLDTISKICADLTMQSYVKVKKIADLSGGFMPLPKDGGSND